MNKNESKIVHAKIVKPADRTVKMRYETVSCSMSEKCDLYKRGECSFVAFLSWHKCPYGEFNCETGYTPRASKCLSWVQKKEEQKKDIACLNGSRQVLAVIGEYVYLPYSFISICNNLPFLEAGGLFNKGRPFIKLSDFTRENILTIVTNRPESLMGTEIKSYQDEEVPRFLTHLKEKLPLFFDLVKDHPDVVSRIKQSNVGRKALLRTLKPNVGSFIDIHKRSWVYDGTYITCNDNGCVPFSLVRDHEKQEVQARIMPSRDAIVVVTSDEQVLPTTEFES